jgi:hypothetical protein
MLQPVNRLRYKVFTSFAIAAFALLGMARLATQSDNSGQVFLVYAILAVLVVAGVWRGVIYLHGVRAMS